MKKLLFLITSLLLVGFSPELIAQKYAAISAEGAVLLENQVALEEVYEIDISNLNFSSQQEGLDYFRELNTPIAFYRPAVDLQKAFLYLQLNEQPEWTTADWNTYLLQHPIVPVAQTESTVK